MRIDRDAYITRAQAAVVTTVSPDSIGKWRARGWLNAAGERQFLRTKRLAGGNLLYRLGDLIDAERDTALNPNSRRGSTRPAAQLRATSPSGRQAPSVEAAPQEVSSPRSRPLLIAA